MKNRLATWLVIGILPLLAACATSSNSAALSSINESASSGSATAYTAWDDAMANSESDIVRLPDGRIAGLLPPEGSP